MKVPCIYCHVPGVGSVTDNSTWFGLDTGFFRYGDYNYKWLQLLQVTSTETTIALVASQIPLTELH
jgi:hypothetical protein